MRVKGLSVAGSIISMSVAGMIDAQKKLEDRYRAGGNLNEEMEDAMQAMMDKVKADSQALCPVDTGRLRASAETGVFRHPNGRLSASVSYDTPYAVYVHENPDAYHAPPTTFKFLEIAFMNNRAMMEATIKKTVRRAVMGR
jgi:hypothetical protein